MSDKPLDSIRRGLEQALAYAEGVADEQEYGARIPAEIDVKAIRARLGMTREEFAGRFGFCVKIPLH